MKSVGVFLALVLVSQAYADDIQLGDLSYAGTGCPIGSASISVSPDQKSISVLFDQYVVEAGGAKAFDRKNCNLALPVHVPQGYSIAVVGIDYRGFTLLPAAAR